MQVTDKKEDKSKAMSHGTTEVALNTPELSLSVVANESHNQQISPEAQTHQKRLQDLHDNRFEKKGARRAFHLVNFLGLHQIFNNVTSVVITYYMATTGLATKMKDSMANGAVGKSLSTVLTAPSKAINYVFKICGMDFNKEINALPKELKESALQLRAHHANRNAIETAFMCVAGFIALFPVFALERNRARFLNWADNLLHPGRSPDEKKAAALTEEDEPKETLWNLFRARVVALAVVFGIDQARANFDSIIKDKHKNANKPGMYKNIDTMFGWGLGNKIYDKLPEGVRGWLARFFSGSLKGEKITLSSMQNEVREDVLKVTDAPEFVQKRSKEMEAFEKEKHTEQLALGLGKTSSKLEELETKIGAIDKEVRGAKGGLPALERAVFSEQARLFITKEVFLTTILSAVIYFCAKSPTALKFMEKIGLQKKGTYEKEHAKLEARRHKKENVGTTVETTAVIENDGKFVARVGRREALPEPVASHVEQITQQSEASPQVAI